MCICVCVCFKNGTLRLWDVASNAKNGYRTQSFCLHQIANKNAKKAHSVHSHERQHLHLRLRQDDNIVSIRTLRQTQRIGSMGVEPTLCVWHNVLIKKVAIWRKRKCRCKRWCSCEWTLKKAARDAFSSLRSFTETSLNSLHFRHIAKLTVQVKGNNRKLTPLCHSWG